MAAPAARAAGGKTAAGKTAAKPAAPKPSSADALAAADAARDRRNDERVKRVHTRASGAARRGFSVASDGAGALLALIAYGPALAYVNGGPNLAKQWFRAKFLNAGPARPGPRTYDPTPD